MKIDTNQLHDVGTFMVSAAAVVENSKTKKILLLKRSDYSGLETDLWEIPCGRIAQHEDLITGLKREVFEETGIKNLEIGVPLNTWHMYRGDNTAENEVVGVTFYAKTESEQAVLSPEHNMAQWVTPEEAALLIGNEGTKEDIRKYIAYKQKSL